MGNRLQFGFYKVGEFYKFIDGQLFGAHGHHRECIELCRSGRGSEQLAQTDTQHLAPLVEHCFHHSLEQCFVAVEVGGGIACHADNGTLHLGRRIEHVFIYGEQVFHIIPRLNKHTQYAIGLSAR